MERNEVIELTFRQREFARLYAEGMRASEAAKAAGYAASTAEKNAARLLRNPLIVRVIETLRAMRAVVTRDDLADGAERLKRLMRESRDERVVVWAMCELRRTYGMLGGGVSVVGMPEMEPLEQHVDEANHPALRAPLLEKEGSLESVVTDEVDTLADGQEAFDVRVAPVKPEVTKRERTIMVRFVVESGTSISMDENHPALRAPLLEKEGNLGSGSKTEVASSPLAPRNDDHGN